MARLNLHNEFHNTRTWFRVTRDQKAEIDEIGRSWQAIQQVISPRRTYQISRRLCSQRNCQCMGTTKVT